MLVLKRIIEIGKGNATQSVDSANELVDEDEEELDQFITMETSRVATKTKVKLRDDKKLMERIRELGTQEKIKLKSNIFGYYEQRKKQRKIDSALFETVMTILSAPATQVSVERAFSALALLLEDIRCNLASTTINNVLCISLNRELVNYVNFADMVGK